MSEKVVKKPEFSVGPFGVRIDAPCQKDFDQFYYEIEYKEVFKETGVDSDGDKTGIIELKPIVKKISIRELLNSQADSVGVDAYIRALMVQGVDINELNTVVNDNVQDFSMCPDNLADTMLMGDKARDAFANLDPALKGEHSTIEGFLNSLSTESLENYIKGRVEALSTKKESVEGGE